MARRGGGGSAVRHFRSSPGEAGQRAEQDVSLGVPSGAPAIFSCPSSRGRLPGLSISQPASLPRERRGESRAVRPSSFPWVPAVPRGGDAPLCGGPGAGRSRCHVGGRRGFEGGREGGRKWRQGTARLRFPRAAIRPCPQTTPDPFFPSFLFVRLFLPPARAEPRPLSAALPAGPGAVLSAARGPSPLFPGGQRELWKGGEENGGLDPPTAVPGLSFSSPSPRLRVARLTPPSLPPVLRRLLALPAGLSPADHFSLTYSFLQFPPSPSSIPPFAHPKADLRPCGPRSPHISLVLRPTFTSLLCLSPSRSPVLPSCCVLPHTLFHFHCCSFQHCTLNCDDRTCPTFQLHRANSVIQTRTLWFHHRLKKKDAVSFP